MQKLVEQDLSVGEAEEQTRCAKGPGSPKQARMCALERHRHVAEQLEIPWDQYKFLNGISE